LTSPELDPTDIKTISHLLSVRYSCLELTGNTLVAAQESKVLEDLNSEFYYIIPPSVSSQQRQSEPTISPPIHILPFSLRLQASRLQSIGFSDSRRGVSALYDLGLECREYLSSPDASPSERELWGKRLTELGIRVVNALVEINDLECAKRTLASLRPVNDVDWKARMGLLMIKIGDLSAAKSLLEDSCETADLLGPLLATAEGRFEDGVQEWERLRAANRAPHLQAVIQQNLAVNYLYVGRLSDARQLMEDVVENGEGYASLTFNLATIYELSSEKSRDLKVALADRVSSQDGTKLKSRGKLNADFKL
jgi:trafficking protein particle complex subunit 12